ncbi:MAG: hypothetical protein CME06_03865 [Gemmatimonadetes bacterium]|nr:hypothetical protein [Gemmatimonadota bacterium]
MNRCLDGAPAYGARAFEARHAALFRLGIRVTAAAIPLLPDPPAALIAAMTAALVSMAAGGRCAWRPKALARVNAA